MAAFDPPWLLMSPSTGSSSIDDSQHVDPNPPTIASFSPVTLSNTSSAGKHRSTILVHQKSPLLIATPPQITRALAYSHPFLLPLNKIAGLLTWTSGDPWESFLLVASFWATVIYGDIIIRWAGPIIVVIFLILGMYSRRYSPLSSTSISDDTAKKGRKREDLETTNVTHQKTLDEIVETLRVFTSRCNVLLDPFLQLTDFLSTQRTATTATTRPALTTLFIRILLVTPLWIILGFPFFNVITTKRVVLVVGTLMMTWHSRPNRVSREILWRSNIIRRFSTIVTGLEFVSDSATAIGPNGKPPLPSRKHSAAANIALREKSASPGVRFTFILFENQRRWIGLGWTQSLFSYERAAWTDEHLNPAPSKEEFELPEVEGGEARWRWVEGSRWLVDGAGERDEGGINPKASSDGGQGWVYFDNKWEHGRRGQDSWGRYTRRRKWYRDAELVEATDNTPTGTPRPEEKRLNVTTPTPSEAPSEYSETKSRTNSGFRKGSVRRRGTSLSSFSSSIADEEEDENMSTRQARSAMCGISDDARMGLE